MYIVYWVGQICPFRGHHVTSSRASDVWNLLYPSESLWMVPGTVDPRDD